MPSAIAPLKDSAKIPVIDISPSNPNAAHDILEAATKFGFVYVENNQAAEMPPANVAGMFNMVGLCGSSSCLECSMASRP